MSGYKDNLFLGADGNLFNMARRLRHHETKAEKLLWSKLCNKQLGVKFRRQHPLYSYVVDFYCHSHGLIIEVDGLIHNAKEARFTNDEVLFDTENVLQKIRLHLNNFQGS